MSREHSIEKQMAIERKRTRKEIKKDLLILQGVRSEDTVGYNAASIETVQYLLDNGFIPGDTHAAKREWDHSELSQPGDLYFSPLRKMIFLKNPVLSEVEFFDEDPFETTVLMAESRGQEHYMISTLGFDFADYWVRSRVLYLSGFFDLFTAGDMGEKGSRRYNLELSLLAAISIPRQQILSTINDSRQRKGVVIGLSEKAMAFYPQTAGDCGDDIRVNISDKQFDTRFISEIHPLGPDEISFFNALSLK